MRVEGALHDISHFTITCEKGIHECAGMFAELPKYWSRVPGELDPQLDEHRILVSWGRHWAASHIWVQGWQG